MAQAIEGFDRLTVEPDKLAGQACIRGYRFIVGRLLELLAAGFTVEDIRADFPFVELEDVHQALRYAATLAHPQAHLPFAESAVVDYPLPRPAIAWES